MFRILKTHNLLFLTLSSSVSQLGDRLTHMVIITLISVYAPGRINAFSDFAVYFTLPVMILAPVAGVVVDHLSKRRIMFTAHVIQAAIVAATPLFVKLTGSMIPIWFTVFLFFGLDLFNNAARNSTLPLVVNRDQLLQANSIMITVLRLSTFTGMLLGGVLIDAVGWHLGFYIDASTHLAAGLLILGITAAGIRETLAPLFYRDIANSFQHFYLDLWELIKLLFHDRVVIFVMISVWVLPFVAAVSYTILIYIIQQVLGMGTSGVGLLGGIIGIGMLAGAALLGSMGKNWNRFTVIILSIAVLGLLFVIGPSYIRKAVLLIVGFVSGITFSFIGICQDTILQEEVAPHIRGRIFSTKEFVASGSFLSSALFIGLVSRPTNYVTLLYVIGGFLLLVAVFAILLIPRRHLMKPGPVETG